MAECYDCLRVGSKAGGTRSQFRLNTQWLHPFKCTYPVHLTDVMDIGQSSQPVLRASEHVSPSNGLIGQTRTVREYEQEITELKKENFNLKLRIYFWEENSRKEKNGANQDNNVELIVELKVETESLRKELNFKDKQLQNALDEVNKYVSELQDLQTEHSKLQQHLTSIEELPTKEKFILLEDEKCNLQKEIAYLENSLLEGKQELEEAARQIEELSARNMHLEEKAKKSSIAIQGFVYKHRKEVEMFPKELRPFIQSAVQAARNSDQEALVAAIKNFKATLCDMMTVPIKSSDIDSEVKGRAENSLSKCLREESFKTGEKFKPSERHHSDPSVPIHHFQDLKDMAKESSNDIEKSSKSLELEHRDYSASHRRLDESPTSAADEIFTELIETPTSINLFNDGRKANNITRRNLNLIDFSAIRTENSSEMNRVSLISNSPAESSGKNSVDAINYIKIEEYEDIVKENNQLKCDISEKMSIIQELNIACNKLQSRQVQLQQELNDALSTSEQLKIIASKEKEELENLASKTASTQTSAVEDQLIQLKARNKSLIDAAHSDNINELKEEILMLLLTVEEKDKAIAELKKSLESLEVELENALNDTDSDADVNERNELRHQLALSCSVNNELMKHLQSLEAFMEDLLHQRNLENSSLDNISNTSDFLSQLSKRLDESVKLSQVLSDQLSICEGSKIFGTEASISKEDISVSDGKSYLGLSKLGLSTLDANSKREEGRNNFIPSNPVSFKNIVGTGKRRCSYSSQHKSTLLPNSDNVVVLGTSNNEDLILLLNENGDPADVLIRNSAGGKGESIPENSLLQFGTQHRRRFWENNPNESFAWKNLSTNHFQTLNRTHLRTLRQGHTWYGHCISSDSDIWSEPDRDVSMQRIGIDVKSSPVAQKSPRKLRFRDKKTTDELSSEKNTSSVGAYKVQSWSRRRRSSGSASKRLFSKETSGKKDCRFEKHYSLLAEKYSKFNMVSNQLEKLKDVTTDKSEIADAMLDEVNGVLSSTNEALHKLAAIKDNSKSFTPIICEKCCIDELLHDLEKTRKHIHASDLLESISEIKVEKLTQTFLSEVDDLKRQLEEPHAVLSSGAECSENENEKLNQLNKLLTNEKNKNGELQRHLEEQISKNQLLGQEIENLNNKTNESLKLERQDHVFGKQTEEIQDKNKIALKEKENARDFVEKENLELQKENQSIAKQLQEFELKNKSLEIELVKIIEKTQSLENKLEEAQAKTVLFANKKEENLELKKENQSIAKQLQEFELKNKSLEKELVKIIEKTKSLENELEEARAKNVLFENIKEENQSEQELTRSEMMNLAKKNALIMKQLEETRLKRSSVEEELENIGGLNKILEKQLQEAENRCTLIGTERKQMQSLKEAVENEKEKLQCQNDIITKDLDQIKSENELLQKEMQEFENKNKTLQKDLNEMRGFLENEKSLVATLKKENLKLSRIVDNLKKELLDKEGENKKLTAENSENIRKLNDFSKKNGHLKDLVHQLEKHSSDTNGICDQLRSDLESTKEQLLELDAKCSEYQTQLSLESKSKAEYLARTKALEKEVLEQKDNFSRILTEKNVEREKTLEKLRAEKDKFISLEKEKSDLAKLLEEKKQQVVSLQLVNSELENKISTLLREKEKKEKELLSSNSLCKELSSELKAMGDSLQKWESKCMNYENEISLASTIKSSFIQKLETIGNELASNTSVLKRFCKVSLPENNNVSDKVHQLVNSSASLDEDEYIENLFKNIISQNSEFLQKVGKYVQELKDSNLAMAENKTLAEKYSLKLSTLKNQEEMHQIEINHFNKKIDNLKSIIDEHLKTISDKEKHLTVKDSKIHELQIQLLGVQNKSDKDEHQLKRYSILETENALLKKDKSHLQTVINELQSIVNNKLKVLNDSESEIHALKLQVLTLQSQIEKTNAQINAKDDEITRLQERIFNLQTHVNSLLAEKIEVDKQNALSRSRHTKDVATNVENILHSGSYNANVNKSTQTLLDLHKSLNSSLDSFKSDQDSDESLLLLTQDSISNIERYKKKIKSLQAKLSVSEKRIEILERDKNDLRENLLKVHMEKSSLPEANIVDKKISELESKLEKKASFIKELKSELYKTCNSLVEKQQEVDDLRQKLSHFGINSNSESSFEGESQNIFSPSIEANINSLRKYKWELMQTIFDIQKNFYEKKGIHLNHFKKFKSQIENLYSLQLSPKLSKSESEPILNYDAEYKAISITNSQRTLKTLLIGLELDVECLENLKIFLKRFFLPFVTNKGQVSDVRPDADDSTAPIKLTSVNKKSYRIEPTEINKASKVVTSYPNDMTIGSLETMRKDDVLHSTQYSFEKMAISISQKIDAMESLVRSLDSELMNTKEMELTLEEKSFSASTGLLLSKLFHENKSIMEKTKIFHLNSALKSSNMLKSSSKQDMSDRESLLSDETIHLSRSQSLSPVSFEEGLPTNILPRNSHERKKDYSLSQVAHPSETESTVHSTEKQAAGSSHDSVCHRSHYSSPDLGIESDPNHDSSAPEQTEKNAKISINYKAEIKFKPKSNAHQLQKTLFTDTTTSEKKTENENNFSGGDTLRAIGILQEYELLKREVQESLVGIKSVLSRTGDGLHHIAKYTSPRKTLEYTTFRAIKDSCANIEVCLKEAYKLVNNFWFAPCPSLQEWNSLIQQNEEQCEKLEILKNSMKKQENDFGEAMEKLQHAQILKENMERKISKKLVKTKKVIRQAELKLLENKCENLPPVPTYPSEPSVCQENL